MRGSATPAGSSEGFAAHRLGAATGIANALYLIERVRIGGYAPATRGEERSERIEHAARWRILNALEGTPVPHPTPVLLCEDTDVWGRHV